MKRLVLDQNLPARAAGRLRELGWDAVHVSEVGLKTAEDHYILEWAASERRFCVTQDQDFHALISTLRMVAPSVIRIRIEGLTYETTARIVEGVYQRFQRELDVGSMITVTKSSIRARLLIR